MFTVPTDALRADDPVYVHDRDSADLDPWKHMRQEYATYWVRSLDDTNRGIFSERYFKAPFRWGGFQEPTAPVGTNEPF